MINSPKSLGNSPLQRFFKISTFSWRKSTKVLIKWRLETFRSVGTILQSRSISFNCPQLILCYFFRFFQMLICWTSGKYLSHWAVIFSWAFNIYSRYFTILLLKSLAFLTSNISTSFFICLEIRSKLSLAISCCRSKSAISCL